METVHACCCLLIVDKNKNKISDSSSTAASTSVNFASNEKEPSQNYSNIVLLIQSGVWVLRKNS